MGKRGELTNVWRLKTSSTPCTHYDTIYVAVQDTLTFKINIASVAQPQFVGVKVYPNPAGSQVTIAISDFTQLSNYTLKIYNTLGCRGILTSSNCCYLYYQHFNYRCCWNISPRSIR